jgi:hypothetical protein
MTPDNVLSGAFAWWAEHWYLWAVVWVVGIALVSRGIRKQDG